MKVERKMKFILIILLTARPFIQESVNFDFKLEDDKPKLEITKQNPSPTKIKKNDTQSPPMVTQSSANTNPLIAPFIQLGEAFKEFTKALNKKKKRKLKLKNKKRKKKVKSRKTMMGALGGLAAVGGAAAVGGMAMKGSSDNEVLEKKISMKENEFGILTIRTKVDGDTNQWLYTAAEKFKGLTLRAKTLMLNGEKTINQITDQIDNIMGNLQAMDNHIDRKMGR